MTATVVLNNCDYPTFAAIRRAVHDSNPVVLTYESYDKDAKRGIFTFVQPMSIPDELIPYRVKISIPQKPNFLGITFPDPALALEATLEKTEELDVKIEKAKKKDEKKD